MNRNKRIEFTLRHGDVMMGLTALGFLAAASFFLISSDLFLGFASLGFGLVALFIATFFFRMKKTFIDEIHRSRER
jgi:hypothetical protein